MKAVLLTSVALLFALPALLVSPSPLADGKPAVSVRDRAGITGSGPAQGPIVLKSDPACLDGVVYDDDSFENGYTGDSLLVDTTAWVMLFDEPSIPSNTIENVCICFTRLPNTPMQDLDFNLLVLDDDGAAGAPGTQLLNLPLTGSDVPEFPSAAIYNIPAVNLATDGTVYIGAAWDVQASPDVFLCADETSTVAQPGFAQFDGGEWTTIESQFPSYAALGVRAEFAVDGTGCVPNDTTLCLSDNRFRVEVDYATQAGDTGPGMGIELTPDTGYFWFFEPENVEMVIKVLNTCSFADRFWVFAGGLTNVEVNITVTDTQTSTVKTYTNPQVTPFQPIQDTNAFATCP